MPEVRKEIEALVDKASTDQQKDVLRRIHELTLICEKHHHTFLRFSGD